jgi:release factor glutamine methyltransferase
MSDRWTVLDLLNVTKTFFEKKGITDSARLDAELLLAEVLDCRRIDLYVRFERAVPEPQLTQFRELVRQRGERRPVKQILGRCGFMSHEFDISPDVLTPRPETEMLVEIAVAELDDEPRRVIDVGTGSGNIAISIALAKPNATVYATDISSAALAVAARNVAKLEAGERVKLFEGDLLEPLSDLSAVDLIVSNPPYVAESELAQLEPEVVEHEPHVALFSDGDGAGHALRILPGAARHLRPGGLLLLELSPHTMRRVADATEASDAFDDVKIKHDLGGFERVLQARKTTGI